MSWTGKVKIQTLRKLDVLPPWLFSRVETYLIFLRQPPPTVSRFLPISQGGSNLNYDFSPGTSPPFSEANRSGFGSVMNDNRNIMSTITFPSADDSVAVDTSNFECHGKSPWLGGMDNISSSSSTATSASNTSDSALSTPSLPSPTEPGFAPTHDEPQSHTDELHNLDSILDQ